MRNKAVRLAVALALTAVLVVFILPRTAFAANPILNMTAASGASGNALDSAGTDGGEKLLQFTSASHVLGFASDSVIVASGRHMLRIGFLNSRAVTPEANDDTSGESSVSTARALGHVTYRGVWDGVTVVYETSAGAIMKSTYYVDVTKEGAQADRIRLGYNRPVQIDEKGNLLIRYEDGTIMESTPVAWQETEGGRKPVTAAYVLHGECEVGFALADYVPGIQVVIDPVMNWNTFLGGSGYDAGNAIAVDSNGNVYVAGRSDASWGSPMRAYTAGDDVFAAKLSSSGALQWHTFLGGSDGDDIGRGIAVDTSGNVYVAGNSGADWGDPVKAYTAGEDGFAAKLNSIGELQWHTFLGGDGDDIGRGIAVDTNGNVYVAGESYATWVEVPVRAFTDIIDGFAAKLNNSGELQWHTFLGGSGSDIGNTIAMDTSVNVYVAGQSNATWVEEPVRDYTVGDDGFAAKLNSNGVLQWHTFLGGDGTDYGNGITVDTGGNVYVAGQSNAIWVEEPVRAFTSGDDGFAAKLNSDGVLQWHTFLGGSAGDIGNAITVDTGGNVYVAGQSGATWNSPVRAYTSGDDGFAAKLNSSGVLQWHTFLGGDSDADIGNAIAVRSGNVYVAGRSDVSWGSPVTAYTAGDDGFAAKLDLNGNFVPGWASHTDADRADPDENTFASPDFTVYMKGTELNTGNYNVAYYDDADTNGGQKVEADENISVSGNGILQSEIILNAYPNSTPGTWHALVQPNSGYTEFGLDSYATIVASPDTYGLLADDLFTVAESAIPEFPTVMAGIVVTGTCFGVFYWIRKRAKIKMQKAK